MTSLESGDSADLNACEKEPLPFSGRIQDVGALLATRSDGETLASYSANVERWFNRPQSGGGTLDDFFQDDCAYFVHRRKRIFEDRHFVIRNVVTNRGVEGDLLLSQGDTHHLYEFEPRPPEVPIAEPGPEPTVTRDEHGVAESVPVENTLRTIHRITHYPKIMLYRFLEDGTGEVVAELSDQQLDTYQGLRFPATDIPRIARNLYIDNPFRLIFDTRGATAELHPTTPDDIVLDLSLSTLRSVSPVHIEYLGNMGVRSSASFPVRVMGKLWGLLAMHSPTPRAIPVEERLQVAQVVEQDLARRLMDAHVRENHHRFNASAQRLEDSAAALRDLLAHPTQQPGVPEPLARLLSCDAVLLRVDGELLVPAPDFKASEVDALAELGRQAATRNQFITDSVHQHLAQDDDFRRRASGLLYATVGAAKLSGRLEILWIRKELASTVTWAGRPEKLSRIVDGEERISPRKSFEAWSGRTRGQSAPWSGSDQLLVSKLLVQVLKREREDPAHRS